MNITDVGHGERSLLLILALGVCQIDGKLYIEGQAGNGLKRWLDQFDRMTLGVKPLPMDTVPADYVAIDRLGLEDRLDVWLMPPGWTPMASIRALPAMYRQLSALIDRHTYLQFGISSFWGDWAALGALIASRKQRKASVWTDRVESEVERISANRQHGWRKWYKLFSSWLTKHHEHYVIRRTTLGLFHGRDTYVAFSPYSPNPHLVHDIHLKPADRIPADMLMAKMGRRREMQSSDLNIIYVGRVHPDKGVMDWIETLDLTLDAGVAFKARWFGEGPELEAARQRIIDLGLEKHIEFPGPVNDRALLLETFRAADIMLFCHQTPESPRCLIEALVSGAPIVGFESAYPQDLIEEHGGGVLTAMSPAVLSGEIVRLANDPHRLADLYRRAARDGHDMNDEAVFAHRSDLMKRFS